MISILKIFLSSILISSFAATTVVTCDEIGISLQASLPFHPDIKITNTANETNYEKTTSGWTGKDVYTGTTEIKWTDYAYSWEQFKEYYKTIALSASGYADAKEASKRSFTNLNISVASLEKRSSWHDVDTLRASGSKWCLAYTAKDFYWGSYDKSGVYYDAYYTDSAIKLRFYLWTNAFQAGTDWIWAESHVSYSGGVISSSWDINRIKSSLDTALSNQIDLESNYSGSLEDPNNINDPSGKGNDETTLINSVIAKILGAEYEKWKQYIQPFSFSNTTRKATIVFKFPDPVTNQQQVWTFSTPINIILSSDYWGKSLSERLTIHPGKIVNPEDSTKGMIDDFALQLEAEKVTPVYGGNLQYHTTAHIEFDGMEDSSEWMTVNGQPVEVLNNKFIYDMPDNRVQDGNDAVNVYDIILYHDDGTNKEQYQIKYTISNLVPTLEEKWYAWDPENNPEQKKLIEPTLPNGKPNPDYDPEVNEKTGTKTQIIWVKKKSQYPFPLDPLDQNGEIIDPKKNPKDYDLGFLAEGSVAGMGVQQHFKANEVETVSREGVDKTLQKFTNPTEKQKLTTIISDTDNKYWSWQGMWHYITETTDGLAYEKYVLIGADYQNKYPRFLDVLDNSDVAVDFWTTIHGVHLKNYLAKYKNLDSKDVAQLNFEQVASYWKEYTSDIIAQRIPPDPDPANYLDLAQYPFSTIKMNVTTLEEIKAVIEAKIKNQLVKTDLVYQEDYHFKAFDDGNLKQLLELDNQGHAEIYIRVAALNTSTKAINESSDILVINDIKFDQEKVVDLSKIKFTPYPPYSFQDFTAPQLKEWILKYINITFTAAVNKDVYKQPLTYLDDYLVAPFDNQTLEQFIKSEELVTLSFTITAQDTSLKAENRVEFALTNDPDGEPAPPDPEPDPDPDPNPNPENGSGWINKPQNLIIMSVIVFLIITGVGTTIFLKYRLKKGIGGKLSKNLQTRTKIGNKKIAMLATNNLVLINEDLELSQEQAIESLPTESLLENTLENIRLFFAKIKFIVHKSSIWLKSCFQTCLRITKKYCLLSTAAIKNFLLNTWKLIKQFYFKLKQAIAKQIKKFNNKKKKKN